MNQLDLADRQARRTERDLTRARWRAFWKLAPLAAMMGLAVSFVVAVVFLLVEFVGAWGVGVPVAVLLAYAAGEAYEHPERYR